MAIEMKVDMLQLFSQWANFTGEKGPKNYWGSFLTYTYSFGKSLPSLNFPSKSFSKIIRSKKKFLTFIESNTPDGATCISYKFGHQMAPVALVPNLVTRWRHLH